MPDRILRPGLFDSEKWLALGQDGAANTARVCYLVCLPDADVFGNLSAGPNFLEKMWRHAGVGTAEYIDAVLFMLSKVRLIGVYESEGDRFLHIFKFRQSRKYLGRLFNPNPDADETELASYLKKTPWRKGIAPVGKWISVNSSIYTKTSGGSPKGSASGLGLGLGLGLGSVLGSTKTRARLPTSKGGKPVDKSPAEGEQSFDLPLNGSGHSVSVGSDLVFPDWLPAEAWHDFEEMRRAKDQKRTPWTPGAQKRMIAKLTALREGGHDPDALLSRSVISGWSDVYPDEKATTTKPNGKGVTPWDQTDRGILAMCTELGISTKGKRSFDLIAACRSKLEERSGGINERI